MQAKHRLKINIAVSVIAALIALLLLSLAMYRVNNAMEVSDIADWLDEGAFRRSTFRSDYLRTNSERAKIQWFAAHKQMDGLLEAASEKFQDAEDRKTVKELIKDHQTTGKIFSAIVENREKGGPDPDSPALLQEVEDRLRTQLNMRLYDKLLNLRKLHTSARENLFSALKLAGWGIFSMLAILITAVFFNSWSLGRVITDRVLRLRDGASVIGEGNLDHRIEIKGDDEFAELADSFNAMTSKLKITYHDLESEVQERKQTEEALAKAYDDLELRVQERTKELKDAETSLRELNETLEQRVSERSAEVLAANAALRDSRRATLNMMQDAVAARQQAEEANEKLRREIEERIQMEAEREISGEFLRLINESRNTDGLVKTATDFFQLKSGCEAVGIRLRHENDYPYYETKGFPNKFVMLETKLCARDKEGHPILDSLGDPVLECMCGNVICGRSDPSKPFFTKIGSFWSNSTTQLLATTTDKDRQARTRNRCNGEGYESVALIALRSGNERLGLLQLNDKRKDRFTPETIALWERLASYLGVALAKFEAEQALLESAEDLAMQNVKLEDVNKELEAFIYSVSHDLRAPLRTMGGFARILIEDNAGQLDEQGRDYLTRITQGAAKMSRLIEDLLDLSKISKQELRLMEIDISRLASNIVSKLREADPQRNVEIVIEEGLKANVDKALLDIVLSNLLGNAWKFTSKTDNARIEFGVRKEEIGHMGLMGPIYFVRDNGAGFNPTYKDKMFGPFQRLHSEKEFPGTGIGLTIVERIIRRHGGTVWAEGEPGKGATVYFTLG